MQLLSQMLGLFHKLQKDGIGNVLSKENCLATAPHFTTLTPAAKQQVTFPGQETCSFIGIGRLDREA